MSINSAILSKLGISVCFSNSHFPSRNYEFHATKFPTRKLVLTRLRAPWNAAYVFNCTRLSATWELHYIYLVC